MKKYFLKNAAAFLAFVFLSPCVYGKSNGSLTLDGIYSRSMTDNFAHQNGLGGSLLLEFQPVECFSIGAGADLLAYFGINTPGITTLESVNLVTRVIFNSGDPFTVYLIGAGGLNPKLDLGTDLQWGGDYRLMGGLGAWAFISPKVAFDLAVVYDYYHQSLLPPADSLQAVDVRLGLSFFFENARKETTAKAEATPEAQPVTTQVVSETTPVSTTEVKAPAAETPAPTVEMAAPAAETASAPAAETAAAPAPAEEKVAAPAAQAVQAEAPKEGEIEVLKKTKAETAAESPVTQYSVLKGDCLWVISGKDSIYGDSFKWPLIFQANRDQIADPDLIYPQQDFSIRRDYTQEEADKARRKASDTPKHAPHSKPRESLPVDYF